MNSLLRRFKGWTWKIMKTLHVKSIRFEHLWCAKKIKIISPNEYYYYTKSDFPFPIADRDLVVLSKQWEDKETGYIYSHSEAAPTMMANEKGTVRVTLFESYWKIMPQKDGQLARRQSEKDDICYYHCIVVETIERDACWMPLRSRAYFMCHMTWLSSSLLKSSSREYKC